MCPSCTSKRKPSKPLSGIPIHTTFQMPSSAHLTRGAAFIFNMDPVALPSPVHGPHRCRTPTPDAPPEAWLPSATNSGSKGQPEQPPAPPVVDLRPQYCGLPCMRPMRTSRGTPINTLLPCKCIARCGSEPSQNRLAVHASRVKLLT